MPDHLYGLAYDLHIHSSRSYDCLARPRSIVQAAIARGLAGIAITDHEVLAGVQAVRAVAPRELLVVSGMEIYTEIGDIVCLGVTQEITSRRASDVIEQIHAQGGIAFLPHPLEGHPREMPESILRRLDGYESLNARAGEFCPDREAIRYGAWGVLKEKAQLGNSDAHFAGDIGRAITIIPGPPTWENLRAAIAAGRTQVSGGRSPAGKYYLSQAIKALKTRDHALALRGIKKFARRFL